MADEEAPRNGQTYLHRLKQGEQHVFWKLSLRFAIIVLDIIAIGAAAWILANALKFHANPYIGFFTGASISPYIFLVSGLSLVFCLVCILVLLLRRPPKPAHPGIAVGCDLVLWLAFLVTALFAVVSAIYLNDFGNDGRRLADPSYPSDYSGEYRLAPNDTWVYHVTSVSPYYSTATSSAAVPGYTDTGYGTYFYNATRGTYQLNTTRPALSSVQRECTSDGAFPSCAAQDAYINTLWHSRHARLATGALVAATQCLNVVLHFVLFVWACVDTHRRNRAARRGKVEAVADQMIRDMQARGLITVHTAARGAEGQPLMAERRDVGGEAEGRTLGRRG